MEKINYPQFISNLPCGDDYTEGKSQKRITEAIVNHIESIDACNDKTHISRIIGLKGEWGIGKTNVIKQLRETLSDKYYVFEYDAWGHQEDLQRRSFLEALTSELIEEKILDDTKSLEKEKENKKIKWKEKLDELLAHRRILKNKSIPVLNGGAFWSALFFLLTPISIHVADKFEFLSLKWWIIGFFPILFGFLVWLITYIFNKEVKELGVGYLLRITKDATTSTINYETVNEDNPSVSKFVKWMDDLSESISEKGKKLIIVYDNMDRLPSEKIKELWSSIYTFFAGKGFENIWVLIPFDEKHLSCAYGESDNKEQLITHFISKTFPVVYRVTPPVITDYEKLFNELFLKAFGEEEEKNRRTIYRIFRLEKPNATVREMIEFINSLVALKQMWKGEIALLYCAIYKLREKDISDNPVIPYYDHGINRKKVKNVTLEEEILSGHYLGNYIKKIIPNDETLQKNISALVYGVPMELAEQIPLIKYFESCFENTSNDINKYSQSSKFTAILQDTILNADEVKTDNIIKSLSNLDMNVFKDTEKKYLWNELAKRKGRQRLPKQEFDESYKTLLLYVDDKEEIIEKLCERLQNFDDEGTFDGANYYNALKDMQDFISDKKFGIDITRYLVEIKKDPRTFVNYVLKAKEKFQTYKLSTDNSEINKYFFGNDIKINELSVLTYINKDSRYNFDELKQSIENFIQEEIIPECFKQIFDAYKTISNEKPLKIQLTQNQRNQIWNNQNEKKNIHRSDEKQYDTDEYREIVAIQLANDENIPIDELSHDQIEYVANQMDYYGNYADLLVNANNNAIFPVLKYMTEKRMGNTFPLKKVLPHFSSITKKIKVTEEELFIQLNDKGEDVDKITKDNIQTLFNEGLYRYTKEIINDLTSHLNKTAITALSSIEKKILLTQISQKDGYWYNVVDNLIDTDFCISLPENVFDIGIQFLKGVATTGIAPEENSCIAKIIAKLDKRKASSTVVEIRDLFCNSQCTITVQSFQYLESWLRQQGELLKRPTEVIHRIIDPIICDSECLYVIIKSPEFYAGILNSVGEIAIPTKQKIYEMIKKNNVNDAKKFLELIGGIEENNNE